VGNAVVVKPSELAPAVGQAYAEIVAAAALPPGVFNLVQGGPATGAALAAHAGVDATLFTGSWETGRQVERAGLDSRPGRLVALEMGGKNAAIVLDDADLELAAREIARSAYATSGQRCSSTSRVIATPAVAETLFARLAALAGTLSVGYGFDPDVFMGPLVTAEARTRVCATVGDAIGRGLIEAVAALGPLELPRPGHYVSPGVHRVRRRDPAHPYFARELFGPDLALEAVADLDEAVARANDSDYGLCLSVFTRRRAAFDQVLGRGRAGVINWNRGTIGGSPHMPFAGLGKSGNHRPGGLDMIRACVFPVASQEGAPDDAPVPGFPTALLPGPR
jgi:succinylglutamic semialdehyde dehydrogenase